MDNDNQPNPYGQGSQPTNKPQNIQPPVQSVPPQSSVSPTQPIEQPQPQAGETLKIKKSRPWIKLIIGLVVLAALAAAVAVGWYTVQLQPVDASDDSQISLEIASGMTPDEIADTLKDNGLIKNTLAFSIHTRLNDVRNKLQAGNYRLSPSLSTPEVVSNLTGVGVQGDIMVITFFPGSTLRDKSAKALDDKLDTASSLIKVGYTQAEVDAALTASYDMPQLFVSKPQGSSLEGYIYGDTYHFDKNTPANDVVERSLAKMQSVVTEHNLAEAYKKQGLTLYEGITLASIVQSEEPNPDNQKQVAQVFFRRLNKDMPLGSDVTAYYGAELVGKRSAVTTDTPYNTRMHKGLPPGPISSPGLSALLAVADPAEGDYEYFLSGDDGVTYFARTAEGHNRNIELHCHKKCAME